MHNKVTDLKREITSVKCLTLVNTITLCATLVWSMAKPSDTGQTTMTTGNVATNLSINGNEAATNRPKSGNEAAKRRGYFTASEYARLTGVSLETVYRHANAGKIQGAELVGGRWRILLPSGFISPHP
jgi:excisionase family DNA binding protein